MKNILTIMIAMVSFLSYGQQGLYQTLEANGFDTEYQEFYSVSKGEKEGTTKVSGMRYWVKAEIVKLETGEKIGFKLNKVDGSGTLTTQDVMSRYYEAKGYPNVSYISHEKEGDGYIATGDYIIELNGISSDGLNFKSIGSVFVKKQVKEKKVKEEKDTVKKKKGAKFLKGLKEAAKNASDLGMSLELKKVTNVDLHKIAKDYLKAIKTTQNSYSLTSKDRADLAKVKAAKEKKYADIKKANDAYWASPEGQRLRESYRKDGGSSKSKPAKAGVKTVSVMVNPNGKATNFVHIHWTENGSSRKKTLQTRSTSSIGNIPENTKLYYTTDNGTNKVYFFTVPSGKSNASVTIK